MSLSKRAAIRYQALDRCFSNRYKEFYIGDLIEACSKAIYDYDGSEEGISRRTIFNDIDFMRSDAGWQAPIEAYHNGKPCYYRYSDPYFSINKKDLNEKEMSQLKETLMMLSRFKGMPNFDWMEELVTNLEDKFSLKGPGDRVIGYEQNPYLNGIERLSDLFNYIINKQPLTITYEHFSKGTIIWTIHPYYIKQYNQRWFLFGLNEEYRDITNIPLDRISDIKPAKLSFFENQDIDFEEYFDDIIGVSIPKGKVVESLQLKFAPERFPYILSKPIHPSQKIIDKENKIIQIEVIPNRELEALILSYGNQVEVLSPDSFREQIRQNIAESFEKYFAVQNGCTETPQLCTVKPN